MTAIKVAKAVWLFYLHQNSEVTLVSVLTFPLSSLPHSPVEVKSVTDWVDESEERQG